MTSRHPYPSYRQTTIPWIGQIPAHWTKTTVKRLAAHGFKTFIDGDWIELPYITDSGIRLIQTGNVGVGEYREQGYRYISEESFRKLNCTEVKPGDILICRLAEPVGRACLAPDLGLKMITSVDVCILKPNVEFDSRFIKYFLSSKEYLDWLQALSRGSTRDRISRSMLGNIEFIAPAHSEQQTIAAYLDHQTAKIDSLIAKKQRLLDLLAEQRTAIISQAVTKGLNPNVKMKDSGVKWLGQVPSHWEVLHFRRVINKFVDYRGHTPQKVDDGIPLITARNIKNGKIDWDTSQEYIPVELYDEWMVRGLPEIGDVLVTMEAPLGETAQIIETHIALAQRIVLLKADKTKIENDYLKYFLASMAGQGELWSRATGSTAIGIKASHLKEIIVIVPPIDEQIEIIKVIQNEEKKIFTLIAKIEAVIERLYEYRAAMISSAVTGMIDVSQIEEGQQ